LIEAAVVDLGGVAAAFLPERRLAALAALSRLPENVVQDRIFDSGLEARAEAGAYSLEEAQAAVLTALEDRVSLQALIEAWAKAFEPNQAVLDRLDALPVPKVLLTNNGPMLDACLGGPLARLRASFDEVICSWHLGVRKPEAAAFRRAATRLGRSPDTLLLLDDSADNVQGARACGWQAERVTGPADLDAALAAYPELGGKLA
jgi:HAD superfamily hydrolase (TIGR01509 family)